MKLNKAEKFVSQMFKIGLTRNQVREAIFEKLGTWNFPPEYEDALATQDPNFDRDNAEALEGTEYNFLLKCEGVHSAEAEEVLINTTIKYIESRGLDVNEEFEKWKEAKDHV